MYVPASGTQVFFLAGGVAIVSTGFIVPQNQLTFLTMEIASNKTASLYVNGILQFSVPSFRPNTPSGNIAIGGADSSNPFNGEITSVQVSTILVYSDIPSFGKEREHQANFPQIVFFVARFQFKLDC